MGNTRRFRELLGLGPDATAAQVRRAYRKAVLKYHPDRCAGERKEAERVFREIAEAYQGLLSEAARAEKAPPRAQSKGIPPEELAREALRHGAYDPAGTRPTAAAGGRNHGEGICFAGMVLGILGVGVFACCFAIPASLYPATVDFSEATGLLGTVSCVIVLSALVGLVLSITGREMSRAARAPTGVATTGLVLCVIALLLGVLVLLWLRPPSSVSESAIEEGIEGMPKTATLLVASLLA